MDLEQGHAYGAQGIVTNGESRGHFGDHLGDKNDLSNRNQQSFNICTRTAAYPALATVIIIAVVLGAVLGTQLHKAIDNQSEMISMMGQWPSAVNPTANQTYHERQKSHH